MLKQCKHCGNDVFFTRERIIPWASNDKAEKSVGIHCQNCFCLQYGVCKTVKL